MADPTCLPPTGVTSTGGVANGNADNIPLDQFIRLSYGLTPGGPYPNNSEPLTPGTNTLDQPVQVFAGPYAPGTTIYYVVQELDTDGVTVLAQSTECSFTLAAVPGSSFQPMPCANCGEAGGVEPPGLDVEQNILCDVGPDGEVFGTALAVYQYDATGLPTGPPTFVDPVTGLPYVPQGILQPCNQSGHTHTEILCDVQTDNSAVVFKRIEVLGPLNNVIDTIDVTLDGAPYAITGVAGLCDPYATCTPTSNQDLNADCGPGEPVNQQVLIDSPDAPLANSVFNDDTTADPLCGGQWDRPADDLPAGFPVEESFRNDTFDQPGPVTQGSPATLPFLTAGPPTNDGNGAGWLRLSDGSYGSNGIWQVPSPFSTSQGLNAAVTLASHDGTTPGGDGQYFVFTDGAAPVQATPIGGFGNLGLNNWSGGVFAVVLDEYGQSCTCGQALPSDPNPGPCGFCGNTISIQRAGASRVGASCACCTVAVAPLAPKAMNLTTRAAPVRLLVSVIEEAGQTYVSASLDWNDGNGPVQYFDRVNITACITVPPTLRMGLSMNSGGSFQAIKEARDAVARPAGISNWRAFPITTDAIPECTQLVNVNAAVDVTFNDDGTQTAGNNNPEAYFYLVNTATNAILDSDKVSALPSQLGQVQNLTVSASVPPADIPNLRVYVGAESRDEAGEYESLWENLEITATGTGCPATPRRTLEISARCPIPVAIVSGGTGGGGGGGTTIVNTPATFEDAVICATVGGVPQTAFRREVRNPDGAIEVTFLGLNGLPITPDGGWVPGPCEGCTDAFVGDFCYIDPDLPDLIQRGHKFVDCDGDVTWRNQIGEDITALVLANGVASCIDDLQSQLFCDAANGGQPFIRNYTTNGGTPVGVFVDMLPDGTIYNPGIPAVPVLCDGADADREGFCYTLTSTGATLHSGWARHDDSIPNTPQTPNGIAFFTGTGILIDASADGFTVVPCVGGTVTVQQLDTEIQILCDANGTRFLRRYVYDAETPGGATITNTTLDGTTAFAPVGAVGICTTPVATDFDFDQVVLCDENGTQFIRRYTFNSQTGAVTATVNLTMAGGAFVPVGAVGLCTSCCAIEIGSGCYTGGSGRYTAIRNPGGTISLIDSVTGAAVLPGDVVACPDASTPATLQSEARLIGDADPAWTTGGDVVGVLTSVTMTVLSGTATLTDSNGTVSAGLPAGLSLTWEAEDSNTLVGPDSIDAVGGQTVVNWTQR